MNSSNCHQNEQQLFSLFLNWKVPTAVQLCPHIKYAIHWDDVYYTALSVDIYVSVVKKREGRGLIGNASGMELQTFTNFTTCSFRGWSHYQIPFSILCFSSWIDEFCSQTQLLCKSNGSRSYSHKSGKTFVNYIFQILISIFCEFCSFFKWPKRGTSWRRIIRHLCPSEGQCQQCETFSNRSSLSR
jgi:hypothetical protein